MILNASCLRRSFAIAILIVASALLASAARAQTLYWIDTSFSAPTLNKSDAAGNAIASVALTAGTLPEGLAVDASGNLYWTEAAVSGARVQRASSSLTGITTVASGGSALRGIVADAVNGKLYWTTSNLFIGCLVRSSALDGSGFTNLLAVGSAANLRGIAVDHVGGRIYWCDFARDALYRANLDGSSMELWMQLPPGSRPYGVAIDKAAQQIYWTEYTGRICRAPLTGGDVIVLLGNLANPTYIALDPTGGQMFWSEGGSGVQHIYKGPMTGGAKTALALPLTSYGGLAFRGDGVTAAPPDSRPREFALAPLAPNPSRGPVRTEYALPEESRVRLTVLDLQGREVAVLADGLFPAGRHEATWNTNASRPVPAGIYFVRLAVGGRAWMRRLVRVR